MEGGAWAPYDMDGLRVTPLALAEGKVVITHPACKATHQGETLTLGTSPPSFLSKCSPPLAEA